MIKQNAKQWFVVAFFVLVSCNPSFASSYDWKVKRVVDGDTLEIEAPFLPVELKLFVRINGVDTPEKGVRAACKKESDLAAKATELMKDLIKKAKNISFNNIKWDKYGGRVLADVIIDKKKASDLLIFNGVARPYHGEKKISWCE